MAWISVKKALPNKKTRYAGKHGVSVLIFDKREYDDSGSFHPVDSLFDFKKKWFMTYASGPKGGMWVPIDVTHWMEMPTIPVRAKKKV